MTLQQLRLNPSRPLATPCRRVLATLLFVGLAVPAFAQDDPKPDSPYVKLLKKAPEERLGPIVDIIGKRGAPDDLAYLYDRATAPGGFSEPARLKALEALAEAATTRDLRPQVDLKGLARLIDPANPKVAPASKLAAIRLSGAWKAQEIVSELREIGGSKQVDGPVRASAFEALASIGGPQAREAIEALASPDRPPGVRALAVAALARFDVDSAAQKAVGVLTDDAKFEDVIPLMAAFLDRQRGAEKLAEAIGRRPPTADGARLALRAIYALGRSDEGLVAILSKSAGLEAESKPPTKEQVDSLVAEVATRGVADRGEAIFRRAELNCMKCHALGGAAGGVGPELGALGLSSPVDYVINSILIPDQAIKEEFQTRIVLTDDGRVLQGMVVEEDANRLVLKDATGETRVVPSASIEDSKRGGSLMPKGLANLLTRAEFVDLVRFLSELGKPGPYAIPTAPTIQRWRVLKSTDTEIGAVLQADPGPWVAAYSQVAGTLPIADIVALNREQVVYLQGEIAVSTSGPIIFRFSSSKGIVGWIDDKPLASGDAPTAQVEQGRHKLTLQVDILARESLPIRVEVVKPAGSTAEFSVVGGR